MFYQNAVNFDKSVVVSDADDQNRTAECTLSQSSVHYASSTSSDQQDQATVVQALMDLNASFANHYPETEKYMKNSFVSEPLCKYDKKPCNCTKSHCLKLYCECFARGESCGGCNCSNCMNNLSYEEDRRRAILQTLERNPLAFCPKIGSSVKKHSKGCNCKRSNCLKNYCECFELRDDQVALDSSETFPSPISTPNVPPLVDAVIPNFYPSDSYENISRAATSEFPVEHTNSIAYVPSELCKFEPTNLNNRMYSEHGYFSSSGISEYPLVSQNDPDQSSYWSILSSGEGEEIPNTQELPRCDDPDKSLLLPPYSISEAPVHEISITSPQLLQQPQNDHLSTDSIIDQQAFAEKSDINYPFTYSNEADLAAAAISSELNTACDSACSNICDLEGDLSYF
ncbi:hypothetical protein Aperf_G00000047368 [Anoplocephala perfoliata]